MPSGPVVVIFDLDGTLLDSDAALAAAYVALGVPPGDVTRGHVVAEECTRLGVDLDDYLDAYVEALGGDPPRPFDGVETMLAGLDRWAVCSNKHPRPGRAELTRLGWTPEVAMFADAFNGAKSLPPVLDALGVAPHEVLYVGDTGHDASCALAAGTTFAWAGWNPLAEPTGTAPVLASPAELRSLLGEWGRTD